MKRRADNVDIAPRISEESRKAQAEPLLRVEKKLIVWSLSIGRVLLILLAIVNHLFPASI
jgi:hypothetical protein